MVGDSKKRDPVCNDAIATRQNQLIEALEALESAATQGIAVSNKSNAVVSPSQMGTQTVVG